MSKKVNDDTIEDSLLEIWSNALPKIPNGRLNKILVCIFVLMVGLLSFFSAYNSGRILTYRSIVEIYLQIVTTLMGFTIAGFTIFISAYSPKFVLKMWFFKDDETGFSMYKAHLLNFINVLLKSFINLVFGFVSVLLLSLINFSFLKESLTQSWQSAIIVAYFSTLAFVFGELLIATKALIYNFYNLTMTQMKSLELEIEENEKQ